jgi:hypothetical protein
VSYIFNKIRGIYKAADKVIGVNSQKYVRYTYNVTLRRVHETTVRVCARVGEWVILRGCRCTGAGVCLRACNLTYPACNASPYCHLRPLWLHHIFRYYLINGTIFGKEVIEPKMCVLIFSKTFLILRIIKRGIVVNVKTSSCKVHAIFFFLDFNETSIF